MSSETRQKPRESDTTGKPVQRSVWLKLLRIAVFTGSAAAMGGLFLLLIGNYIVMPLLTWSPSSMVPDLYGTDLAVAKRQLIDEDLVFINDSLDFVHDEFVPANHVVSQDPPPYAQVKTGRRVRVVISRGPQLFPVPPIIDTTPRDAQLRLQRQGFHLGRVTLQLGGRGTEQYGSDMTVGSQDPPAGTMRARGDSVHIVAHVPPVMPDLRTRGLHEATQILGLLGLRRGSLTYEDSPELLPHSIVRQSIEPGERITSGDRVNLVLSRM